MHVELDKPIPQRQFALLIGVSPAAVHAWVERGVLKRGDTARAWILAYCTRLRQSAEGHGGSDSLAAAQLRLVREQADKLAMVNAAERAEFGPKPLLEAVLAAIAHRVAATLATLVPRLRNRHPAIDEEALRMVEGEVAAVRSIAAAVRLRDGLVELDVDEG